jgi:hypothetical protein
MDTVTGVELALSLALVTPLPPQADNSRVNEIASGTEDLKILNIYTSCFR